jgi:hypothetical protein
MVGEMVVGERLGPRILHGLAEVIHRTRQILHLLAHKGGQQYAHTLLPAPTCTRIDNRALYSSTDGEGSGITKVHTVPMKLCI